MDEPLLVLRVENKKRVAKALRAGDLCPKCNQARLEYNGLLNLACPSCDYVETGGCFS